MLRMRGVPTLTPTGATKCNCLPNGNSGGGRRCAKNLQRQPGARADLTVEVKARKWLTDVAIVCPATESVVTRQPAKAGEAVKRKKEKGAVQGFVVEAGGRLGPAVTHTYDHVILILQYQYCSTYCLHVRISDKSKNPKCAYSSTYA
jgi:hypothetical protein